MKKTPKVEQLTPETIEEKLAELNQQIDQAVEAEDFGLADELQHQVDSLKVKLTALQ